MTGPVHHVKMGELAQGSGECVLKATLGSCVGIALVWPRAGRAALAHCLLPDTGLDAESGRARPRGDSPARCVDQAVPALLDALGAPARRRHELQAHLAGGACLRPGTANLSPAMRVGALNVEAARRVLKDAGITLVSEQVEGHDTMQITVDCRDLSVLVVRIQAPSPSPVGDKPSKRPRGAEPAD